MQKKRLVFTKLSFAGLLIVTLCWGLAWTPAQAGEWEFLLGASWGDASTVNGDVTLRRYLEPLYAGEIVTICPLIEASGIYWHNSNDTVWGGGVATGLQINFWQNETVSPFISGSFGGVLLSDDTIDNRDLGCLFQFRSKGSVGLRFGEWLQHSIQFDIAHFSNAGLSSHNAGFNTYGVAYGFRF